MASEAGAFNALELAPSQALFPQHNTQTSTPGLPVAADVILYSGCMVAYDPAASEAVPADPAMAATAKVIGVSQLTTDNTGGAKGDKQISPKAGIWRMKSDGNLTAAHLYKKVRVVDDHTVGVPAGDGDDRIAGLLIGLEDGFAWLVIAPEIAVRAPVEYTMTSTNGAMAAAADDAAIKAEGEKIGDDVRAIYAALVTHGLMAPPAA
jgi:hypothetical protein